METTSKTTAITTTKLGQKLTKMMGQHRVIATQSIVLLNAGKRRSLMISLGAFSHVVVDFNTHYFGEFT